MQLGKHSDTTISSFDELRTPNDNLNGFNGFNFQLPAPSLPEKSVEGPVGPHLFRMSQESSQDVDFYLSMSPPLSPQQLKTDYVVQYDRADIAHNDVPRNGVPLHTWTPRQVADWMHAIGFEQSLIDQFYVNDISGTTLIDLQYEDLKELGIASFGQRHRLWNEIRNLKGSSVGSAPPTPNEDPCYSPIISKEEAHRERPAKKCSNPTTPEDEKARSPTAGQRHARRARRSDDVISPAESASIVAIEQLLPKPHKCSKGENCTKWQKQQRKLAKIATEFPLELQQISDAKGSPTYSGVGATSVIVPSLVASSDLLGPAQLPSLRLEEDTLRIVQARDPQENVRQFLNFQHLNREVPEEPTTPPYEMFPPLSPPKAQAPHSNLRSLPKLTIPSAHSQDAFSPDLTAKPHVRGTPITAMAVGNREGPYDIYRYASPMSEMDVPVTAIPAGPVERDFSSSVPPDMRFGATDPISRSASRVDCRRPPPSFAMPPSGFAPIVRSKSHSGHRRHPSIGMPRVEERPVLSPSDISEGLTPTVGDVNYAGWMKKRKTKMLRHEWHENHFRLKGTCLAMHKDDSAMDALECIDVDDYAVACSAINSNKINAAFKSLKLSGKKKQDGEAAAFAFQLVPSAEKVGVINAALGKTHHFAVKTGNERVDWMRELLMAKAKRQKAEGYQVNVNGNVI